MREARFERRKSERREQHQKECDQAIFISLPPDLVNKPKENGNDPKSELFKECSRSQEVDLMFAKADNMRNVISKLEH